MLRGGVRAFFRARPALLPAASAGFGDQFKKLIPSVRLRRTLDRKLCKEACVAMSVGWWDACCFRQLSDRQAGVRAMKKQKNPADRSKLRLTSLPLFRDRYANLDLLRQVHPDAGTAVSLLIRYPALGCRYPAWMQPNAGFAAPNRSAPNRS